MWAPEHVLSSLLCPVRHRRVDAAAQNACMDALSTAPLSPDSDLPPSPHFTGESVPLRKAPAWMRRPAGASFGFGGKLVSFANHKTQTTDAGGQVRALVYVGPQDGLQSYSLHISFHLVSPTCHVHGKGCVTHGQRVEGRTTAPPVAGICTGSCDWQVCTQFPAIGRYMHRFLLLAGMCTGSCYWQVCTQVPAIGRYMHTGSCYWQVYAKVPAMLCSWTNPHLHS